MADKNKTAKKILIIRFGAIGDVVHSSIIQKAIKAKYPDTQIDFMTSSYIEPMIARDKNLNKTYAFNMKHKDNIFYLIWLGLKLRFEKYDVVINLQNSFRNQFLSLLSGSKYIKRGREGLRHSTDAFFESAKLVYPDLEKPDCINLYTDEKLLESVKEKLGDALRPYIIISPGGDNDIHRRGRIWSFEHWNELGKMLKGKFGGTIIVVGSKSEGEFHRKFIKIDNAKIFSGELSLEESVHLFSLSDLFISGDSGPLHMATATGVNTLGLYGSTSLFCAPYGKNGHIIESVEPCRPCQGKDCPHISEDERFAPCMKSILPAKVFDFIVSQGML